MNATIIKENVEGIRHQHRERQEKNGLHHGYKAVAIKDGKMIDLVDLRIAYTSGGTPYACIWLHSPTTHMWSHGSGTASGYGYHKASAAVDTAISNAGVRLSESINGRGDAAIREAVDAIGVALEPNAPVYVVEMHP